MAFASSFRAARSSSTPSGSDALETPDPAALPSRSGLLSFACRAAVASCRSPTLPEAAVTGSSLCIEQRRATLPAVCLLVACVGCKGAKAQLAFPAAQRGRAASPTGRSPWVS
ncbi:hypothetical protein VPH35_028611 [Triticum aestivum]